MFSNLSAISSQSPPICLQKSSGVKLVGIYRFKPGGAIGLTTRKRSLGVLNLKPLSVFPVKDMAWKCTRDYKEHIWTSFYEC